MLLAENKIRDWAVKAGQPQAQRQPEYVQSHSRIVGYRPRMLNPEKHLRGGQGRERPSAPIFASSPRSLTGATQHLYSFLLSPVACVLRTRLGQEGTASFGRSEPLVPRRRAELPS
jgi:hypothetical protein